MSDNKKVKSSADLIPMIISAKSKEGAVDVIMETLDLLGITESYHKLTALEDTLKGFKDRFKAIQDTYKGMDIIAGKEDHVTILELRKDLGFFITEVTDELGSEIYSAYKEWDDPKKSEVKAICVKEAKAQDKISDTLANSVYADNKQYKKYLRMRAKSYSLFKDYEALLDSLADLKHQLAAEIRYSENNLRIDAK